MKGSLIIVGFFVLGTLCGVSHLIPFDIAETNISYYALRSEEHTSELQSQR